LPEHGDRSGRGGDEPGEESECRRLAGAIGSEERDDLSVGDVEREILDGKA